MRTTQLVLSQEQAYAEGHCRQNIVLLRRKRRPDEHPRGDEGGEPAIAKMLEYKSRYPASIAIASPSAWVIVSKAIVIGCAGEKRCGQQAGPRPENDSCRLGNEKHVQAAQGEHQHAAVLQRYAAAQSAPNRKHRSKEDPPVEDSRDTRTRHASPNSWATMMYR